MSEYKTDVYSSRRVDLSRSGVTVLEVLFSVGIILVGLVGIAAMVPFAARQASQSYSINHAIASASNTLDSLRGNLIMRPTIENPWILVEDVYRKGNPNTNRPNWPFATAADWNLRAPVGATNQSYYGSLERLYDGNAARGVSLYRYHLDTILESGEWNREPQRQIALAQNRALGQGFCIDPYFLAAQLNIPRVPNPPSLAPDLKIYRGSWGYLRRSRFPFYDEVYPNSLNPFEAVGGGPSFRSPRLLRVSFRDNSLPLAEPADLLSQIVWLDRAWARNDTSRTLASGESRDLDSTKSEDRTSTYRQFSSSAVAPYSPYIKAASNASFQSWIITMTPVQETPLINHLDIERPSINYLPSMRFFPEDYDVSIVMFSRRNVQELSVPELEQNNYPSFVSNSIVPQTERLARVVDISAESASAGSFEIDLDFYTNLSSDRDDLGNVSSRLIAGDWLMLSRHSDLDERGLPRRERHKWYQVLGVLEIAPPAGLNVVRLRARIAGGPWDWTVHEIDSFRKNDLRIPNVVAPNVIPTVATVLRDVVAVYERRLSVKK